MEYYLDTADIDEIEALFDIFPLSGVTTNPSILAREKRNPYETLEKIRSAIKGGELFVETLGRDAATIEKETEQITGRLGKDTIIKIPATPEGIKAIGKLSKKGYICCATAVFSLSQALLSSRSGAKYVAPYISRIDSSGGDGCIVSGEIAKAFSDYLLDTKVIGASFKTVRQVEDCARSGVDCVTLPPDILRSLLDVPGTKRAVEKFEEDWKTLGAGDTL
ncbi:MAG: transaldolase family protein [Candidatus Ornithospirochaeta sp.]